MGTFIHSFIHGGGKAFLVRPKAKWFCIHCLIFVFLGLLRVRSRDSYKLSPDKGGTPASSDDELEAETSFTTFKPAQKGLVNTLYKGPLIVPSVSHSDDERVSSEEDTLDAKGKGQRRSGKAKNVR